MKQSLFILSLLFAAACNKLEEDPNSIVTASQFYKTQSDAVSAVSAVYSTLNTDAAGASAGIGNSAVIVTPIALKLMASIQFSSGRATWMSWPQLIQFPPSTL